MNTENQTLDISPDSFEGVEQLAKELNIHGSHTLPDFIGNAEKARQTLREIHDRFLPGMRQLDQEELGAFLFEKEKEICDCFEEKGDMWRIFMFITPATVQEYSESDFMLLIKCVYIYLVTSMFKRTGRLANTTQEKSFRPSVQAIAYDIQKTEILNAWGSRTRRFLRETLGAQRYSELEKMHQGDSQLLIKKDEIAQFNIFLEQAWSRRGIEFEKIYIKNPVVQKSPETAVDALSFLFCQNRSFAYRELLQGAISSTRDQDPIWCAWIERHIALLADRKSQTYKAFCFACELSTPLFEGGSISREARKRVPPSLQDTLEKCMKKHTSGKKEDARRLKALTAQKTTALVSDTAPIPRTNIIVPPISGADFDHITGEIVFEPPIPANIDRVEIRIRSGNGKVWVMGTRVLGEEDRNGFNLYSGKFVPGMNGTSAPQLGKPVPFRGGEIYTIGIVPIVGVSTRGAEYQTQSFKIPRAVKQEEKIEPTSNKSTTSENVTDSTSNTVSDVLMNEEEEVTESVTESLTESVTEVTESVTEVPEWVRELRRLQQEAEAELRTAVEMCLEFFSEDALTEYFSTNASYENGVLRFEITKEMLAEIGYIENQLVPDIHAVEGVQTFWTIRFKEGNMKRNHIPERLALVASAVRQRIITRSANENITRELDAINMSPNGSIQGKTINITNHARLAEKIAEWTRRNGGRYRLFTNARGSNPLVVTLGRKQAENTKRGVWQLNMVINSAGTVNVKFDPDPSIAKDFTNIYQDRIASGLFEWITSTQETSERAERNIGGFTQLVRSSRGSMTKAERRIFLVKYKRELEASHGRLVYENKRGELVTLSGINRNNLITELTALQSEHGKDKVAFLLRRDTYAFWRDNGGEKIHDEDTQERSLASLDNPRNQEIIYQRCVATLYGESDHDAKGRAGFDPEQNIHPVLMEFCDRRFQTRIPDKADFERSMSDFIEEIKMRDVPLSYRQMLVELCPAAETIDLDEFFPSAVTADSAQSDRSAQPVPV